MRKYKNLHKDFKAYNSKKHSFHFMGS